MTAAGLSAAGVASCAMFCLGLSLVTDGAAARSLRIVALGLLGAALVRLTGI